MKKNFATFARSISLFIFVLGLSISSNGFGNKIGRQSTAYNTFSKPQFVGLTKTLSLGLLVFLSHTANSPAAFSMAKDRFCLNESFLDKSKVLFTAASDYAEQESDIFEHALASETCHSNDLQALSGVNIPADYLPKTVKPESLADFKLDAQILNKGDIQIFSQKFSKDNFAELGLDQHAQFSPECEKHDWDSGVLLRRVFVLPDIDAQTLTPRVTSSRAWIEQNNKGMFVIERRSGQNSSYLKSVKKLAFVSDVRTSLQISQETEDLQRFSGIFMEGLQPSKIHEIKLLDSDEPILKLTYSLIQFVDLPDQSGVLVINNSIILMELDNREIRSLKKIIVRNLPEGYRINDLDQESIYYVKKAREYAKNRQYEEL